MKKDKFTLFIEQSKFQSNILNNAKLKEVLVDPLELSLTFSIVLQNVVEVEVLKPFIESIKTYFMIPKKIVKVNVNLLYESTSMLEKLSSSYFEYVIYLLTIDKPRFLVLKNYQVIYKDNTFTFQIDKDSKFIKKHFKDVVDTFKTLGLNVTIDYEIKEDLVSLTKKIKETEKEQAQMLDEQNKLIKEMSPEKQASKKQSFTRKQRAEVVSIKEIPLDQYRLDRYKNEKGDTYFLVSGNVSKIEIKLLSGGKYTLLSFVIGDKDDAILVKTFLKRPRDFEIANQLKEDDLIEVEGNAIYDTYQKDVCLMANSINFIEKPKKEERLDKAKEKRIEFHLHTKMSNMDAVNSAKEYIDQALKFNHEAIAFTDHNGLYAYPEIYKASKGKPIKPIYGVELDYVNEEEFLITSISDTDIQLKDATYVVFDLETTGLSNTRDKIIEIGALKIENGIIIDKFQQFVNPNEDLSSFTIELTGITDEDLSNANPIDVVLPEFLDFAKDSILVAHNALFDTGHIVENAKRLNIELPKYKVIDTLNLARYFYSNELKRFNLKAVARLFKISLENHHRAEKDTEATAQIWLSMLGDLLSKGIKTYFQINEAIDKELSYKHVFPNHLVVLAKNQTGYQNLFRLVSEALTTNFHNGPRTTNKSIHKFREGLLIGSGCYKGEIFETALNRSDEELVAKMDFYDYIEVQPPLGYKHLENQIGLHGNEVIKAVITKIIKTAKEQNKLVIASGDVHYINKEDTKYRDIYIKTDAVGGGIHDLRKYDEMPEQYFLSTDEMLKAFDFLPKDLAYEIVVKNTNILNQQIDNIEAFPNKLYSLPDDAFKDLLGVESISFEVKRLVYDKLLTNYGQEPHPIVSKRVKRELDNIIENEFAPIYYISHLLVKKSLNDGYLVGSRGSVGSSLVATLLDITEVNPLKPHYRCKKGHFTVFELSDLEILEYGITNEQKEFQKLFKNVQSGYDLKDAKCPYCNELLLKDGHDIPFETFLGFDGDKVPDIDLNFSGDYQAKAHDYVKELLGSDHTFRAGTIQTVADKNAYGYVKAYLEKNSIEARNAQIERLAKKIEGVRRSTGQHPGGIVVVPKHKSIYDVTPIQFPADDTKSEWKTTHFDYHSFESNLLKLDILGHDDPTMIKYLMDYVTKNSEEFPFSKAQDIPLDDRNVYRLFSGTDIIDLEPIDIMSDVASFGIPEFGTPFTRQMLIDTKPNTFAGLVKISGLSHGNDVWLQNAKSLVDGHETYGKIPFDQIIGCRDDIMVQLSAFGMNPLEAFEIMEFVRKGKPSVDKAKWLTYEQMMKKANVPAWYIWSCSKIKYMFPKAHATAYVIMAIRIAWFKVYKPLLFYSAFFSKRAVQFDHEIMVNGTNAIRNKLNQLNSESNLKVKDENLIVTLGVALEMTKRGFKFLKADINKSEATTFAMEKDGLRMPFIAIDGLGESVAYDIVNNRNERSFTSKQDVLERTKINKTVFEKMDSFGAFDDLSIESSVISSGLFAI